MVVPAGDLLGSTNDDRPVDGDPAQFQEGEEGEESEEESGRKESTKKSPMEGAEPSTQEEAEEKDNEGQSLPRPRRSTRLRGPPLVKHFQQGPCTSSSPVLSEVSSSPEKSPTMLGRGDELSGVGLADEGASNVAGVDGIGEVLQDAVVAQAEVAPPVEVREAEVTGLERVLEEGAPSKRQTNMAPEDTSIGERLM